VNLLLSTQFYESTNLKHQPLSFPKSPHSIFHSGHMARLSKTSSFQIYSDNGHSTSGAAHQSISDEVEGDQEKFDKPLAWDGERRDDGFVTESDDERKAMNYDGSHEGDDEKNYTRTSISSFPESSYPTDYERTPVYKPYTPTYARPSSRRMQMTSPLRKGRFGTPYSEPRGSPRSRRKDLDVDNDSLESKKLPLVLLHITVLPLSVPWTYEAMRDNLPKHLLNNLQLLKSKLSDTVLKRGILIPHPGDDYELLEEKLLEALDLQEPRISKCGHYRNRRSTNSILTTASSGTDSGVGSSVDGSDEEHCSTCHHHLRAAGTGKQKWSIKVYASNGLMRASAWSAAWSEMERVDTEIMPYIKDELRIKLDETNARELIVKDVNHEADEQRINQLVEERIRLMDEHVERAREAEMSREIERIVLDEQRQISQAAPEVLSGHAKAAKPVNRFVASPPISTDLPNIYRPKDIPLSILLWNYLFLLARKPRNMAMFFLVMLIGGIPLIVEPAMLSAGIADVSTLVVSKAANIDLNQDMPTAIVHQDAIQSISDVPAQLESIDEIASGAVLQTHDDDAVTVSDSAPVPKDDGLAFVKEQEPEEVHKTILTLDRAPAAEPEPSSEQENDGEGMGNVHYTVQLEVPEMVILPDSAFEPNNYVSAESVWKELEEKVSTIKESDDLQDGASIPLAPQIVETHSLLEPGNYGSSMSSDSPHSELADKCRLLYPVLLEMPAFCGLDEEHDGSSVALPSKLRPMNMCLPYSIFSGGPGICETNGEAQVLIDDIVVE
jgi:hypothetical protein